MNNKSIITEELKKELIELRKTLVCVADMVDEKNPVYNYFMNGLMFVDEAARIANGEHRLNEKWLHYYADRCN